MFGPITSFLTYKHSGTRWSSFMLRFILKPGKSGESFNEQSKVKQIDYTALGLEEIPVPVKEPNFEEKLTEQSLNNSNEKTNFMCSLCGF